MNINKKALAAVVAGSAIVAGIAVHIDNQRKQEEARKLEQACVAYETEILEKRIRFARLQRQSGDLLKLMDDGASFKAYLPTVEANKLEAQELFDKITALRPAYVALCGEGRSIAWNRANYGTVEKILNE